MPDIYTLFDKTSAGRMKRRLLIAILVILAATLLVTGLVPIGTVAFYLDKETYYPDDTVTITVRSPRTGRLQFGRYFAVERFEDGHWVEVPLDRAWGLDIIGLRLGRDFQQSFIPAEEFVETPQPGRYRVVREVRVGPIWFGALVTRTLIAEFHIETPTSDQQAVQG